MLKITIPQYQDLLFETILKPTALAGDKIKKNEGEGEINTIFGKSNKIAIGLPYHENIVKRYIEEGKDIPYEIKQMIEKYDFHFLSLCCSFLPDTNCQFIWARFGVELFTESSSEEPLSEEPIAFDIFPDEVLAFNKRFCL